MRRWLAIFLLSAAHSIAAQSGLSARPETVTVQNGGLHLRGLLWRPAGQGPFAGVVFNHGLGETGVDSAQVERIAHNELGPTFARHGYVLLVLFRRGEGLSRGQGNALGDSLAAEGKRRGPDAARMFRERMLTTEQLDDVRAGVRFLRAHPNVDPLRVAIAGHSFGAMLSILAGESDSTLRAVVDFAGAAVSWNGSPTLRARLLHAAERLTVPTFFIYAANDFSVAPGEAMAAVMGRRRQPHQLKIYPPEGSTKDEGHAFVYRATSKWESDVFAFLDQHVRGSGSTTLARSAKPNVVHVIAHDYAFEAPEVARAGLVTFDFENRGEKDHELLVGLLRPGMGASDIVAAHQKGLGFRKLQDAYLDGAAPGVLFATPHTRSPATFTLPFVAGRTYVLLCQLRDSVGAPQHAAMGMFRFMHATR